MHAGRISGERREIARRQWINDVGHCRHAAADALAGLEILQRFQEIIFALPDNLAAAPLPSSFSP